MSLNDKYSKSFEDISYKLERFEKKINDFIPSEDLIKNKEYIDDFEELFQMYEEEIEKIEEEIKQEKEKSDQSLNEKINEFKNKIELLKNKYNEKKNIANDIEKKVKQKEIDSYRMNQAHLNKIKDKNTNEDNIKTNGNVDDELNRNKICFGCKIF